MFASLATGNTLIVKPHPSVILPLAITVQIARDVLAEAGFDPNVVLLEVHPAGADMAPQLDLNSAVKLIDFTSSRANGNWLEQNAGPAQRRNEEADVNRTNKS